MRTPLSFQNLEAKHLVMMCQIYIAGSKDPYREAPLYTSYAVCHGTSTCFCQGNEITAFQSIWDGLLLNVSWSLPAKFAASIGQLFRYAQPLERPAGNARRSLRSKCVFEKAHVLS